VSKVAFPDGFIWGVATSSYQVEGAVAEDGRGESIWDRFSHTAGKVVNGDTGDVAADHYHRWPEDVALMAELRVNAYRFSIAWPRLFPQGGGTLNPAGIAFYDRLIDALLERGIRPLPTLYHWDLPQALEDKGGWRNRSTVDWFTDYARAVFDRLGDRVETWFTINEPWIVGSMGHYDGTHAPGLRDLRGSLVAEHHVLLAHGQAVRAFRDTGRGGRIAIVLNLSPTYPATDSDGDRQAAKLSDGYTNRWFLDPVLRGAYPSDMVELFEGLVGPLDFIQTDDLDVIASPTDLLAVNYYNWRLIGAGQDRQLPFVVVPAPPDVPRSDGGWEIVPDRLTDLLLRIRDDYGDVPLVIAENGVIVNDGPGAGGRVRDTRRSNFIRDHLVAAHRAIDAGVRLEGYIHWSLLDNFEWAEGYWPRFGLVHVDFETQQRTIKDSGRFYTSIIEANGLDPENEAGLEVPAGR
jgi:beta-glucosidase